MDMQVNFEVHPRGWPSVQRYPATDFRHVIADFLEADVGASPSAVDRLLAGIEQVRRGEVPEWKRNGNMFSLAVTVEGCHLRQYDPPPKPGTLTEGQLTHDDLGAILRAWREHVIACGRPKQGP
jgi:hypothetical protein